MKTSSDQQLHKVAPSAGYRRFSAGFTMVEILVVVAILGIITAIALPSYRDSQLRGGRAEGKAILLEAAAIQERFYSINNTYTTNANPFANPVAATLNSENGRYVVSIAACGTGIGSCFVATATAQGNQVNDTCGNLTLSSTGVRGSSGGVATDCWAR